MNKKLGTSLKHVQIDKANTAMIIAVSVATFIVVFAGFLGKSLLDERAYQAKVIAAKEEARDQMASNVEAVQNLNSQYEAFVSQTTNLIGGNSIGGSDIDGDNAKLVLDSLPSRYDFPALVTSIEKILTTDTERLSIAEIRGTDEELLQLGLSPEEIREVRESEGAASAVAQGPVEMPFGITVEGDYDQLQLLIGLFERSIRPFHIENLVFAGGQGSISLDLNARTYYQPARVFEIEYETVQR